MSDLIIGRNACLEALKAGREIEKLRVLDSKEGKTEGSLLKIIAQAKDRWIPV